MAKVTGRQRSVVLGLTSDLLGRTVLAGPVALLASTWLRIGARARTRVPPARLTYYAHSPMPPDGPRSFPFGSTPTRASWRRSTYRRLLGKPSALQGVHATRKSAGGLAQRWRPCAECGDAQLGLRWPQRGTSPSTASCCWARCFMRGRRFRRPPRLPSGLFYRRSMPIARRLQPASAPMGALTSPSSSRRFNREYAFLRAATGAWLQPGWDLLPIDARWASSIRLGEKLTHLKVIDRMKSRGAIQPRGGTMK